MCEYLKSIEFLGVTTILLIWFKMLIYIGNFDGGFSMLDNIYLFYFTCIHYVHLYVHCIWSYVHMFVHIYTFTYTIHEISCFFVLFFIQILILILVKILIKIRYWIFFLHIIKNIVECLKHIKSIGILIIM